MSLSDVVSALVSAFGLGMASGLLVGAIKRIFESFSNS